MGELSLTRRIRQFFSGFCWRLFLRFEGMTSEEYWKQIDRECEAMRKEVLDD